MQRNPRNNQNDSFLLRAASDGLMNMVEVLLRQGANVDAENNMKKTPLMCAAEGGYKNIVEFLLKAGANTNKVSRDGGYTALMLAVRRGDLSIVELLVNHGTDINLVNQYGDTAIYFAVNNFFSLSDSLSDQELKDNYREIFKILYASSDDIDAKTQSMLDEKDVDGDLRGWNCSIY